jgi:Protein kinase domain
MPGAHAKWRLTSTESTPLLVRVVYSSGDTEGGVCLGLAPLTNRFGRLDTPCSTGTVVERSALVSERGQDGLPLQPGAIDPVLPAFPGSDGPCAWHSNIAAIRELFPLPLPDPTTAARTTTRYKQPRGESHFASGANGRLYLVGAEGGRRLVEKRMPRWDAQSDREAAFLSALAQASRTAPSLACPFLVEAFGYAYHEERREHCLYFELLPGMDLKALCSGFHRRAGVARARRPGKGQCEVEWTVPEWKDEPYWLYYFWQVVEAVEYMHELGYVHGDLKRENVMLDWFGNAKVGNGGKVF